MDGQIVWELGTTEAYKGRKGDERAQNTAPIT